MIVIREATPADAARLLEIYDYYVRNTAISFECETPTLDEFTDRMRTFTRRYPYLLAEEDGVPMGYAYAHPFVGRAAYDWSCELTIYLDKNARGRGMGRLLYAALERALLQMGVCNLYACIGDPEQEDAYLTKDSARFHAHLGFCEIGRFTRCGRKFDRWYDMIWMEKLIAPHTPEKSPITPWPQLPAAVKAQVISGNGAVSGL